MSLSLSPASQSTRDIWPTIFAFAISDDESRAPGNLRRICRSWNTVIINTPALWTTIDIEILRGKISTPLSIITARLRRAKTLPLTIRVRQLDQRKGFKAKKLMTVLMQCSQQWYSVHFELPRKALHFIQDACAPILHSFTASITIISPKEETNNGIWTLLSSAPLLQRLSMFGMDLQTPAFLETSALTTISIDRVPSVRDLLETLRRCPSLTEAAFGLAEPTPTDNATATMEEDKTEVVIHHTLRSITLTLREEELEQVLSHTSFPSLRHLFIRSPAFRPAPDPMDFAVPWPQDVLIRCLETSSCSLESLELFGMEISGVELCALLEHPAVFSLQILRASNVCEWSRRDSVALEVIQARTKANVVVE